MARAEENAGSARLDGGLGGGPPDVGSAGADGATGVVDGARVRIRLGL